MNKNADDLILQSLSRRSSASIETLSAMTGLKKYKICKILSKLQKWGLVHRTTRTTSWRWKVAERQLLSKRSCFMSCPSCKSKKLRKSALYDDLNGCWRCRRDGQMLQFMGDVKD